MFRSIGEEKSSGLLSFHAFAGCDQTLPFAHFDQKTAWEAWGAMDNVMTAFQAPSKAPVMYVVDEVMPVIFLSDKSACIMYDRTSTFKKVNDAQKDLSTRKGTLLTLG